MTDEKMTYLSQEKFDSLTKELADIKNEVIPAIAKKIDMAKQMGDLSENAEYHAAREEMAWAQSRAKEINHILDNSEIVSKEKKSSDFVSIGSKIEVKINGQVREYTIVGAQEADPLARKISNESPLGEAFMGKKKGDKVDVHVPSGIQTYTIISIN
ncbi:MAG: hypothetical protein A2725_04465 [Candidatus Magasanikbacteria bacterium RIFCSPHIGHO2_01_FULL_33_34]|uniref:Transcription elongation factor GreA n=1 Tax=Candidatus Magasanikbacteria bacterium RIFCSPHIGHO2_01_FULL_33_34 TaxID=1798671 RepID=A0A1F6LHS0_9BACT|nr:MAG: hypothetical protein A2725_04465 [Candidatus Magasanikbacteria bacterium RIFCSPHIGHO2_01_FULL_33_34]OGH65217.1 MAG: hypothetical protein A3B83_04225 [Candidatus Magasanikbacteria bacterium RIFCSPHIGHO2_02_FULL_33_17]OGH75238.1 MAG: hypothetical protein A3A89_03940 [Candidatus Magasanikbacteria bacterium RIFCSPLOWO2_01_FULL_33_34]OGH82160.1 MAG: hypothetical protein A3F93_00335 [Candidatus Magasanikbacteria bacterium RIFCSPLOWO2_12_FULL_34_7]